MPKLTRHQFLIAVDDVWGGARRNFEKDKVVHGHLVAFDAKGHGKYFLHGHPDDPNLVQKGIIGIPGPWHEHLPLLAAEFHAHRAVAAILVGEAWIGTDEAALDMVRMGLAPHEHPMKDEVAFVAGLWPREYAMRSHYAIIERDEQGQNPRLGEDREFGGPPDSVAVVGTWLAEMLPRPYR